MEQKQYYANYGKHFASTYNLNYYQPINILNKHIPLQRKHKRSHNVSKQLIKITYPHLQPEYQMVPTPVSTYYPQQQLTQQQQPQQGKKIFNKSCQIPNPDINLISIIVYQMTTAPVSTYYPQQLPTAPPPHSFVPAPPTSFVPTTLVYGLPPGQVQPAPPAPSPVQPASYHVVPTAPSPSFIHAAPPIHPGQPQGPLASFPPPSSFGPPQAGFGRPPGFSPRMFPRDFSI